MSRSVFVSACGDVFILSLVMKLWQKHWYDETDEFLICFNNNAHIPSNVVGEFLSRASQDPKVSIIYHPNGIGNGMPIQEMTLVSKKDFIMLLEDDGFIFTPHEVDSAFKQIENGHVDALGSPRGSCGKEVWDAMQKKYTLDYSGYGDVGPNYWPNFFFCKREDLLKTDMNFGSKKFPAGEYFKELDHTFVEDNFGDTFVWADIQMRYNGVRFGHIPQYHAMPSEIEDYEKKEANWKSQRGPFWMHGGSLSAGLGGYLSGQVPDTSTLSAKTEIESRVAWWQLAFDNTEGYGQFRPTYQYGIELLINKANLERTRINKKMNIYRELIQL